jgi:hypothetical protein
VPIPSALYYYEHALTSERVIVKQWYLGPMIVSACRYRWLPTVFKMH